MGFLILMGLALVIIILLVVMGVKHQRLVKKLDAQSLWLYGFACVIALPWLFYMWLFLMIVFQGGV